LKIAHQSDATKQLPRLSGFKMEYATAQPSRSPLAATGFND
jgi:hypothetical protein